MDFFIEGYITLTAADPPVSPNIPEPDSAQGAGRGMGNFLRDLFKQSLQEPGDSFAEPFFRSDNSLFSRTDFANSQFLRLGADYLANSDSSIFFPAQLTGHDNSYFSI
jgi:hypothetical protein